MRHKKPKNDAKKRKLEDAARNKAERASITKEMAEPRMSRSARIAERNLDPQSALEHPSTTLTGTAKRIIPSRRRSQPEKAEIAVREADRRHRDLRIENALVDEDGDEVRLKKGARVAVTVTGDAKTKTASTGKRADSRTRRATAVPRLRPPRLAA
jgi:hypothetical protein